MIRSYWLQYGGLWKKKCRHCPEKGEQDISNFGKYKSRNKILRRNTCFACRTKIESERYKTSPEVQKRMKLAAKISALKKKENLTDEEIELLKGILWLAVILFIGYKAYLN